MPNDTFTTLNPGANGDSMDESAITYGGAPTTRKRERIVIGDDSNAAGLVAIINSQPAGTEYGAVAVVREAQKGQATMANSRPVVIASDQSAIPVAGDTASGATDAGNPIKMGAVGHTANPTAVTDGQRVNVIADKVGRQVVTLMQVRDLKVNSRTSISTTTETTILTAVASTFLDLTQIVVANTSGTKDTQVDIRDSTAGTIRTTLWCPASSTTTVNFADILTQATVNNNWTATLGTAVQVYITVLAVKNI